MNCTIMGDIDGNHTKLAFDTGSIRRILSFDSARSIISQNKEGLTLKIDDRLCQVEGPVPRTNVGPYFIVLNSYKVFNVFDYKMLFDIHIVSDDLLCGIDVDGHEHLCKQYPPNGGFKDKSEVISLDEIGNRLKTGEISLEEIEYLKEMITDLRKGKFFEALTMEFSDRIKEIIKELIEFRKDIQKRLEPSIVKIAELDIPEASNQLEGINETLEKSTMKIMDINDEQLEIANCQQRILESFISNKDELDEELVELIEEQLRAFRKISNLALRMMEPLSFQDLVGQRIQKIIRLVNSMEQRINDLIISLGIKLQKHKEDPTKSFEDLSLEVEEYKSELKSSQEEGEGLDQAAIDELLASL